MRFLEDGTGCVVFEGLLGFVNAILSVTVFATPYWQETSYSDSNGAEAVRHSGLWQNCSATTCTMIPVMAPGEEWGGGGGGGHNQQCMAGQ